MRKMILAAAMATVAVPFAASPADAQSREVRQEQRECDRELRNADSRREYNREARECREEISDARQDARQDRRRDARRNWRNYRNYDYNRYERGNDTYYADDYYRDGRYYRERRLTSNDRIYRGRNGQYYCRRNDGTTGLIIGAGVGALVGNSLDNGRSSVLGTLLGAGAGALIGREVDRGSDRNRDIRCR